jgi:GntR family transcriptional regulator
MTASAPTAKGPRRSAARRPASVAPAPASSRRAAAATKAEDGAPRYLQIARELTAAITSGRYPVGAHLPTELELCAHFAISRFTAREAVRVLSSAGLVTRRQRVGTVVIATPDEARYTHAASSITDLFQYAQDTELRLIYIGKLALARERAQQFGAKVGDEWTYAMGLRSESTLAPAKVKDSRPICVTRLFLNPVLKGIDAKLRERKTAVYAIIEREYKRNIQRVEQELQSVALDADDAANLGSTAGSPALLVLRRYYDDRDQLLEVAENIHPGDRFTYRMQLRK